MRILKEDRVNLLTLVNFLQEAGCEVSLTEPFNKELAKFTTPEGFLGFFSVSSEEARLKFITFTIRFPLGTDKDNLDLINTLNNTIILGKFCIEDNNKLCISYELPYSKGLILAQFAQTLAQFGWLADSIRRDYNAYFSTDKKPGDIEAMINRAIH